MKSEMEIFHEYIRRRGLRRTPEREEILQEIFGSHDHFDVDELYLRLRRKRAKVSKASIYRALRLFQDCGLIREVYFDNGHWHYEHIYGHGPHCHLRCLTCGRIVEFQEPALSLVQERLAREHGYRIADCHLEVKGYCRPCQEAAETEA
jgi:Fur family ferric uptake transcriptional regulator